MPIITKSRNTARSFTLKLLLFAAVHILISGNLFPQVEWIKYPGNPVLQGQPGTWYAFSSMNSVLYNPDSSRYEMWFTAGAQIPFPYTIGFATSADGITWNVYSSNPVLSPNTGEWDAYTVLAPYVIRENGKYRMWYTGCATSQLLHRIGYATSSDGINWTKHPSNPVLEPGTASWESASVAYGCVMPFSNGYKMWYSGASINYSPTALGYATSPDGINWERHTGNPVLTPGATSHFWDHLVFGPRVLEIDNAFYMFYSGETILWNSDKIGLATSPDGLIWTKYPANPVLQPTPGQWDDRRTNLGSVLMDGDTLKMYYTGMNSSNMQIGLATSIFTPPLLPGTYTVGTAGKFPTIQDAFSKLSTDGVAGNVTLELIDELYRAPTRQYGILLNGPIPGAGPDSRVTIKPAENKNVVIEGGGQDVLTAINTSYVTIDGVDIDGSTTLTFYAYYNYQFNYNASIEFIDNSDHNIFRNMTFISDDIDRAGGGPGLITRAGVNEVADSNIFENNFIKKCGAGAIYLAFNNASLRGTGNIIRGNYIGSDTDSLLGWGIQVEHAQNTIIENNIIQNLKYTPTITSEDFNIGINSYSGLGDIIRNNVIHNVRSSTGTSAVGILLSGGSGSNNIVYNNMIYDIQSSSTQSDSRVTGIQIFKQTNPKIYYNTVYLSGTGTNHLGSAAFYVFGGWGGSSGVELKNNIFVNTRDEGPYCASAIYDYNASNLTSDYNVLHYDDTNSNNCLVRAEGNDYKTLGDWQATGKDEHSYAEMPPFLSPTDLHIDETVATYIESGGIPITGIDKDFDGHTRHSLTPDIGADEFNGMPVGVEDEINLPTEYALEQNYPNPFNPSTVINYQLPVGNDVTLKIFDVLGNEIATLVDEYKTAGRYEFKFDCNALPSGVYFYQLKASDYVNTKKMILLK